MFPAETGAWKADLPAKLYWGLHGPLTPLAKLLEAHPSLQEAPDDDLAARLQDDAKRAVADYLLQAWLLPLLACSGRVQLLAYYFVPLADCRDMFWKSYAAITVIRQSMYLQALIGFHAMDCEAQLLRQRADIGNGAVCRNVHPKRADMRK